MMAAPSVSMYGAHPGDDVLKRNRSASFNESFPDSPIIIDMGSPYMARGGQQNSYLNGNQARVLDILQLNDGTYLFMVRGITGWAGTITFADGQVMRGGDTALIHMNEDFENVSWKVFNHYVWSGTQTPDRLTTEWRNGPRAFVQIDESTIAMSGVLGYESYQYASIDSMNSTVWGESFFVAKVNLSDFSIVDYTLLPAAIQASATSNDCRMSGYQEMSFIDNKIMISFNLHHGGGGTCPGMWIPNGSGTHYSVSTSSLSSRSTNLFVTLDENLSFLRSTEVPSPHEDDMGPVFLGDGTAVVFTQRDPNTGTEHDLSFIGLNDTSWTTVNHPCGEYDGDAMPFNSTVVMWSCDNATSLRIFFFDVSTQVTSSIVVGTHDCGEDAAMNRGAYSLTPELLLTAYSGPPDCVIYISGNATASNAVRMFVTNLTTGQGNFGPALPTGVSSYSFTTGTPGNDAYSLGSGNLVRPVVSQGSSLLLLDGQRQFIYARVFEIDTDADYRPDRIDSFPSDPTQWMDADGDGYGDNPLGNEPDDCVNDAGNSSQDRQGCPDHDGDGWSNEGDPFPTDATQYSDLDGDGFGDNSSGMKPDACPSTFGESSRDRYGCPDRDFDGWSDAVDAFPDDSSQWADRDGDGYGDNANGLTPDGCPDEVGNSTEDRFGCPDSDGDGWSDAGDALPSEPTQWSDRDGDGWGDDESGNLNDTFPLDSTQWADRDGDGFGDNEFGNNGDACPDVWGISTVDRNGCPDRDDDGVSDLNDAFPDDPTRWQDTDGDGVEDSLDEFPFDPTQDRDRDGDGFGDNDRGSNADKFPDDPSQWSDIDGDGYGDNQTGNNSDEFIADPTQWSDSDGDGFGDNSFGRNSDAFPNDPTQWEDQDGDGYGDNLSGNDPDPYLFDFDNDGYNDSIDPLPMLASPGDIDNDGCPDEEDAFLTDFRECRDFDGDGIGDNADPDDDNDGWADTDEVRQDTDPFDASDYPVDVFQLMVPGTAIGLDGWDLIGIFGGFPIFAWILFGFITRNSRAGRFEAQLKAASSKKELEAIALKSEYALMIRLIGAHQGIRLERLRAELDDDLENPELFADSVGEDQTDVVEQEMAEADQPLGEAPKAPPAAIVAEGLMSGADSPSASPPPTSSVGIVGQDGYEWLEQGGATWYRPANSGFEWLRWND